MPPAATAFLSGLFTGWTDARLGRLSFGVLFAVALSASYLMGYAFLDALADASFGDRRDVSSALRPLGLLPWGQLKIWIVLPLLLTILAANANVVAKRFRDMGLPGWLTTSMVAIIIIVLLGGGSALVWVANGFVLAVFLALLSVPADRFEAGSGRPRPRADSDRSNRKN